MQFSDDSAFRDSTSGADRPHGISCSTAGHNSNSSQFSSSYFSSSDEGKPSMDSVLRPQIKHGMPRVNTSTQDVHPEIQMRFWDMAFE